MTGATSTVAVGVITYRRPDKLERLLLSLEGLASPSSVDWHRTIIVDNDPEGSAKPVVDEWLGRLPGLTYVAETNTGLSTARNRAIEAGTSDWMAFIDDDEEASTEWLVDLLDVQSTTSADAVMGNTRFAFESSAPSWLSTAGVYGFEPDVGHGESTTYLSTNNLLVRTSLTNELGPLFDERFSKTGGEDHHLGHRLRRQGYKIVQSHRAWTTEWVPEERMTFGVVAKRLQRDGNTLTIVDLALAHDVASRRKVRLRHLGEGLLKIPLGCARGLFYATRSGSGGFLQGLRTSFIGIGQLKAVAGHDVLGYHVDAQNSD